MRILRSLRRSIGIAWLLITAPPDSIETDTMNKTLKSVCDSLWLTWLWSMKLEILALIGGIALFFHAIPWIRAVDPTAAGLDGGYLGFIAIGLVAVIAGVVLLWVLIKITADCIDSWFDDSNLNHPDHFHRPSFERDWWAASPAVRLGIFIALFGVVVLGVCIVVAAAL